MKLLRVDQILQQLYPQWTRSKIQTLIEHKKVRMKDAQGLWKTLDKPGTKFDSLPLTQEHFLIEPDEELNYVSRGALKLKAALENFEIDVSGHVCLDVGLSTGGFTDLLLKAGAFRVLGVDVGINQLHQSLKNDKRLVAFEKINIREGLPPALLKEFFVSEPFEFDLIVVDVSFISLSLVIPPLASLLSPQGKLVLLLKPQFELTAKDLNKKGVVKDLNKIPQILEKIDGVLLENKLKRKSQCPSPIEGENGNKEILILALPQPRAPGLL